MKKLMIAVFICTIGLFSCKGKSETDATDTTTETTETTELTPDTTATAPQPINDTVPGVESSGSQEQIP